MNNLADNGLQITEIWQVPDHRHASVANTCNMKSATCLLPVSCYLLPERLKGVI